MSTAPEQPWIRRLLDVGCALMTELDPQVVLDRVLETARELTGARYAALGILNERRTELDRFLTLGVDEETHRSIGSLPRGRGVLGVLIDDPRPLRLGDVGEHPRSYGFPAGHPVMRSFLGVPVLIRGEVWGNLYLTEKEEDSAFTEADEEAAAMLADWAAVAIENARTYQVSERRRRELERAFRGLEATHDVVMAIGEEISLENVLELTSKRGRALVDARSLMIMLREGTELVTVASAGHVQGVDGMRLPITGSTPGQVLERGRPERIADVGARLRPAGPEFGAPDPHTALLVPMIHRGEAVGVLATFDQGEERGPFSEDDEQLLRTFAASAATAVALAKGVQSERLRSSLAGADAERSRWARELHDETLQSLGGLRVLLSTALRRGDAVQTEQTVREAVGHIEREIENLRAIITELRPAALDQFGLRVAIEALVERHRNQNTCTIESDLALPDPAAGERRLAPELETTVYRLVQEALTNVAKHAQASKVRVAIGAYDEDVRIEVRDDGLGFAPDAKSPGFGLAGMHERVNLAGGTLSIDSGEQGTLLRACLSSRTISMSEAEDRPDPKRAAS
jgi:signal transduction histidine kinase